MEREDIKDAVAALEMSADAVVACDPLDGAKIVYWSDGCSKMFGYTHNEVEGRQNIGLIVPAASIDNHRDRYIPEVATGQTASKPMSAGRLVRGSHKNGSDVECRIGLHSVVVEDHPLAVATLIRPEGVQFVKLDRATIAKWAGLLGTGIVGLSTLMQTIVSEVIPEPSPTEQKD